MKLTAVNKYKSFNPFSIELPDFTILTGVNGGGKTQILTAIANDQMVISDSENVLKSKMFVVSAGLSPKDSVVATRDSVNQSRAKVWEQYRGVIQLYNRNPAVNLLELFGDNTLRRITQKVARSSGKSIPQLTELDFYKFYPIEDGLNQADIFYQNLSNLFKRYSDRVVENDFQKFLEHTGKAEKTGWLNDTEFVTLFGEPPWDLVNLIIRDAKLDYKIIPPNQVSADITYEAILINTLDDSQVKFSDLSSGEKVLMSLAMALCNANFEFGARFPTILLLDEPDASLHPSMSKRFLEIISGIFVDNLGVKVIMTTHSPSTIAFAKEENIYVVNRLGERIVKTTKDKALKILTTGVPSFSINYENRRQVFVESVYDVMYYERLYRIIGNKLAPEISLSFIASGESRTDKNGMKSSNCGQVKNITTLLRTCGNTFVWGIIDWDLENRNEDFIKVLGEGSRYNIENYLFDPLLLAALLLREKLVSRSELGLVNNESYTDFKSLTAGQLQVIIDFVSSIILRFAYPDGADQARSKVKLLNGIELLLPVWYLQYPGHDLEGLVMKAFPKLGQIKKDKEALLKLEIINKVVDDVPEILSNDFLELFRSIQAI